MNWLAHLHLSAPSAEFRLGNVLPDLAPQRDLAGLRPAFQRGIDCHRRIDAFTDAHPTFRQSVARVPDGFRRFGGIIVDVLYDHFLTLGWERYADAPLRRTVDDFYGSFDGFRAELPPAVWPILAKMRAQDWLGSYGDLAGVQLALRRIGRRLRKPRDLGGCIPALGSAYPAMREDFAAFYPALEAFVASLAGQY